MLKNKSTLLFAFFTFVIIVGVIPAQTLIGTTGLYLIPSGELGEDKSLALGIYYIGSDYFAEIRSTRKSVAYYATLVYLPAIELNMHFTKQAGIRDALGDRMFNVRIRLRKETMSIPSIVIGFHDFYYGLEGPTNRYNSTYIVCTKNMVIDSPLNNIALTLGYGADIMKAKSYQFIGVFGGVSFSFFNSLELMFENDAKYYNTGLRLTLLNHIKFLAGYIDMKYFNGGMIFSFNL